MLSLRQLLGSSRGGRVAVALCAGLLMLMCLVAAVLAIAPGVIASRFANAVKRGDIETANRMLAASGAPPLEDYATPGQLRQMEIGENPVRFRDLLLCERFLTAHIPHGENMGDSSVDMLFEVKLRRIRAVFALY